MVIQDDARSCKIHPSVLQPKSFTQDDRSPNPPGPPRASLKRAPQIRNLSNCAHCRKLFTREEILGVETTGGVLSPFFSGICCEVHDELLGNVGLQIGLSG